VKGRQLVHNIVDLGAACVAAVHAATPQVQLPLLILFDFAAAYPSVSRAFMLRMLRHVGASAFAIFAIAQLYNQCSRSAVFLGEAHQEFEAASGVEQGCCWSSARLGLVLDAFATAVCYHCPVALPFELYTMIWCVLMREGMQLPS
jgi:hypothetical protein